jgi:hypothetical protein
MLDFIKRIWHDPVWSKVIAAGIIGAIATCAALFKHIAAAAVLLTRILSLPMPLWPLLATIVVIVLLLPYWWRAIRKRKPELFIAWHDSAGWGIGGLLQKDGTIEHVLRLQGSALISSSHLTEPIVISGIELRDAEYAGPNFQMFDLKPGETTRQTLLVNFRGVKPEKGKAFRANLTLVDIKGDRYPLRPVVLRAFPSPETSPKEPPVSSLEDGSLVFDSPDEFSLRVAKVDSGGIRGIELQVENYRLTSIHQIRLIISKASSFDGRHGAFREGSLTGQTFVRPDLIRPSTSGRPILLVWKAAHSAFLVTGENNILRELLWPDNDKAQVERWKLSLRVQAFAWPPNSQGQSAPLKEISAEIIFLWNRTRNEFSIEKQEPATAPPVLPAAFPLNGEDGTHREIVRFIMCGGDQLLAYKTTREGLSGTRFLVVRVRPNGEPQSLETQDRDGANAKWNELYQEWKKRGFGGASGNGLDGAAPF